MALKAVIMKSKLNVPKGLCILNLQTFEGNARVFRLSICQLFDIEYPVSLSLNGCIKCQHVVTIEYTQFN